MTRPAAGTTTDAQRAKLAELMRLLLAHEPLVDYPINDVRGILDAQTFRLTEHGVRSRFQRGAHIMADCSEMVTCLCLWSGLRDPNGLGYGHAGYTGTMLAHLPHYTNARQARIGALAVFGPATGDHVAMVLEPDFVHGDPLLFSHGFEGGPIAVRLSHERAQHRAPVTLLSIAGLGWSVPAL